jgi:regulator of sigma E protease
LEGVISQGPLFIACLVFLMGIVIVIHELGHYLAGRLFGVAVESFSVGFGKPMFERRDRNGTRWRVNWIPLGGFVAFIDKQTAEAGAEDPTAPKGVPFRRGRPAEEDRHQPCGPDCEFRARRGDLLGFHRRPRDRPSSRSRSLRHAGHASRARRYPGGDQILAVNGKPIRNSTDVTVAVMLSPNTPLETLAGPQREPS